MAIGTEPKQGDVEQRPRWIEHRCAIGSLQGYLIAQGGFIGRAVGRHRMNILRRYRRLGKHCLTGHAVVAVRMVVRNEPLIAPVPKYTFPRKAFAKSIGGQKPIEYL